MVKSATFATRFVSYADDRKAPAKLRLAEDQEVVAEDPPTLSKSGALQRFVFIRGPLNQPVHIVRRERLPDGSAVDVRYEPELDVICSNTARG